eukprot:1158514-Pelagomonas_calceolata.AAC.3
MSSGVHERNGIVQSTARQMSSGVHERNGIVQSTARQMSSGVHERNGIVQSTARHERQCICHTECMGFMQTGKRDACSQMHASQYATHRQLKKFDSGPIRGTGKQMTGWIQISTCRKDLAGKYAESTRQLATSWRPDHMAALFEKLLSLECLNTDVQRASQETFPLLHESVIALLPFT